MRIPLSNSDLVALVDDEDYERLIAFRWHAVEGRRGDFYAQRAAIQEGRGNFAREMQRDILDPDMTVGRELIADHRNHNTLDNRRRNLRWLDHRGSVLNRRMFRNNTSGYRGVSLIGSRYQAALMSNGVRFVSYHHTAIAAARAYNDLALLHHGEHARLNVIAHCMEAVETLEHLIRERGQ